MAVAGLPTANSHLLSAVLWHLGYIWGCWFFVCHRLCSMICHAHSDWPGMLAESNIAYISQTTFHDSLCTDWLWLTERIIPDGSILRYSKELAVLLNQVHTFSPLANIFSHLLAQNSIYHIDTGSASSHLRPDSASGFLVTNVLLSYRFPCSIIHARINARTLYMTGTC